MLHDALPAADAQRLAERIVNNVIQVLLAASFAALAIAKIGPVALSSGECD